MPDMNENAETQQEYFGRTIKVQPEESQYIKSLLYCTTKSCNNCGNVNCENFQRQRKDCCDLWISYKDYIKQLESQIEQLTYLHNEDVNTIKLLNEQIRKMKCCANCAFQVVIGGVRDRHCVKCNACSEWELED